MTTAPGQMRFINSSLVTSSPADWARTSIISKAPTDRYWRSKNPKFAAGQVDLALA
jgi:hypothetical protein